MENSIGLSLIVPFRKRDRTMPNSKDKLDDYLADPEELFAEVMKEMEGTVSSANSAEEFVSVLNADCDDVKKLNTAWEKLEIGSNESSMSSVTSDIVWRKKAFRRGYTGIGDIAIWLIDYLCYDSNRKCIFPAVEESSHFITKPIQLLTSKCIAVYCGNVV